MASGMRGAIEQADAQADPTDKRSGIRHAASNRSVATL
jgi:hypothetical protein